MSSIKPIEKKPFEDLFGMSSGYVLDFTNRTFAEFFRDSLNMEIYSDKYVINGDSKAKRLRAFWDIESDALVGKALSGLLEFWEVINPQPSEENRNRADQCKGIVGRLLGKPVTPEDLERQFLSKNLDTVSLKNVKIDSLLLPILESRLSEVNKCLHSEAPLAVIFLCGSVLEGLLLGLACDNAKEFNQASNSPKDREGKVKQFQDWTLANFIDVAFELGYLKLDVKKFSHALRDFRNYIHPYEQMRSQFNPDKHTAEICLQVVKAAIASLSGERK